LDKQTLHSVSALVGYGSNKFTIEHKCLAISVTLIKRAKLKKLFDQF